MQGGTLIAAEQLSAIIGITAYDTMVNILGEVDGVGIVLFGRVLM